MSNVREKLQLWNRKEHKQPVGFTLVELLVVISIIALLLSIMLPALRRVRDNAKALVCKSNIAQLSLAAANYSTDNREYYSPLWMWQAGKAPPGGYWFTSDSTGGYWFWPQIMGKYMGDQYKVAGCPAGRPKTSEGYDPVHGSYGMNIQVVGNGDANSTAAPPVRRLNVRQPGRVILVCDSGTFYATSWMSYAPTPETEYLPGSDARKLRKWRDSFSKKDATIGRHPDMRICIGFVDCHSDWVKVTKLIDTSYWMPSSR